MRLHQEHIGGHFSRSRIIARVYNRGSGSLKIVGAFALLLLVAGVLWWGNHRDSKNNMPAPMESVPVAVSTTVVSPELAVSSQPIPKNEVVSLKTAVKTKPKELTKPVVPVVAVNEKSPPISMTPPATVIHKELIPKNIEIVRVYYQQELMGPGSVTEFDINGTGFTREFEQMITVVSGLAAVQVKDLRYVTLNQIHGTLVVASTCPTSVGHPQVLINGKVVFQAREPYAVIRPNEVLNVIFTEMGESGRSGRFRIYTNLTPENFSMLSVSASTPAIQVEDLKPQLPYMVDATVQIGPALVGEYGLSIRLADKTLWERSGAIRIVQPDATEPGLAQRIRVEDGYYRPNDTVKLIVHGSGFQPRDTDLLTLHFSEWGVIPSSWIFVAPGRLDAFIKVPSNAAIRTYDVDIMQGKKTLLNSPNIFSIVPQNWVRSIRIDPPLYPGKASALILEGRDFSKNFVEGLKASFDEEGILVDSFNLLGDTKIVAGIQAGSAVDPGDYLMLLSSRGLAVNALTGNVIRISVP